MRNNGIWIELTIGVSLLVCLYLATKVKAEDLRPVWTAVTCYHSTNADQRSGTSPEECVVRTLNNLMSPEVAVKAKVIPILSANCGECASYITGYTIFYPSR